ncbi:MAG: malonyl-CoA/methylmalonyl-CoA synthetase [Solirubrobacteraceae bacterium]|nr:malonyl-CoA/methylmalonyl-CoA synthetase [Solirubrobacteraceae bacterium]
MSEVLFPALERVQPPTRTALAFPEGTLSYAALARASAAVGDVVRGHRRVAVLAEPRLETCVAVIGALRAGVPIIPVNPRSGERELRHIASDADPALLLAGPGSEPPAAFAPRPTVTVGLEDGADTAGPAGKGREIDPEAPALIVYTSGTTGPPKGVVLPHRALASNLDALADAWGWTERDTVTHGLPLFHVHGLVVGILGPVRRGGGAVHVGRFSPEAIAAALGGGATMLFGVPTMYRRLAQAAEADPAVAAALAGSRLLISGSAPLPVAEHARISRLTGRGVLERYGMTETLMNTALRADGEARPGTVGEPVAGVELRLVDEDGATLNVTDDETMGEIEVRGPNLFVGYLGRPEATAAVMHDGWFHTGDMATRDERGYIRIVGRRATDLIKSGGYKIGAGEIEAALREHPAVDDAAVAGEPDADLGERVVAWVVLRGEAETSEAELIEHVADQLAPHKRPRHVRFLDELPRNELGKIQKQRLTSG